jgi:tetratricopeptide (TPR) repeat protein
MFTRRQRLALTFFLIALCTASVAPAFAQSSITPPASTPTAAAPAAKPVPISKKPPSNKLTDANGRVVILSSSTPESKEDDAINHQMVYSFGVVTETNCQTITDKYTNDLIPVAQHAKFPKNQAKYLEIAHEAIGACQATQGRYIEAEQNLHQALTEAEIWPGKDDSKYADLWIALSTVQLKEEHWKDAEASATQTVTIRQGRIDDYNKVLPKVTGETADNIRKAIQGEQRWRCTAFSNLAYASFREGNLEQAAKLTEQAYQEGVAAKARPQDLQDIEYFGAHLADLTNNSAEAAKWAARADTTPQPPASSTPDK